MIAAGVTANPIISGNSEPASSHIVRPRSVAVTGAVDPVISRVPPQLDAS